MNKPHFNGGLLVYRRGDAMDRFFACVEGKLDKDRSTTEQNEYATLSPSFLAWLARACKHICPMGAMVTVFVTTRDLILVPDAGWQVQQLSVAHPPHAVRGGRHSASNSMASTLAFAVLFCKREVESFHAHSVRRCGHTPHKPEGARAKILLFAAPSDGPKPRAHY